MSARGKTPRSAVGRRVTAIDVARLAGVSRSAVSRALTPGASISERTREKVMLAAAELGYRPNLMARSLMTRQTRLVALVMAQLRNPFFTDMLGLFNQRFREHGYQTLLLAVDGGRSVDEVIESVFQYQPEGAIMVSCSPSRALTERCAQYDMPIVVMDRNFETRSDDLASHVWVSSNDLGRQVAERLLADGRKRVALVEGNSGEPLSELARCFMECMLQADGVSVQLDYGQYSYQGGYDAGLRLLRSETPPDAVFCVTDPMALGVLDAARQTAGLDVPADLSLIGFSDVPAAAWHSYQLTTVRLPIDALVNTSVDLLLKTIEKPGIAREHVLVECPLIERGTTRPLESS